MKFEIHNELLRFDKDFFEEVSLYCNRLLRYQISYLELEKFLYENEKKFNHPVYYGPLIQITGVSSVHFNDKNFEICRFLYDFLVQNEWRKNNIHFSMLETFTTFENQFGPHLKKKLKKQLLS